MEIQEKLEPHDVAKQLDEAAPAEGTTEEQKEEQHVEKKLVTPAKVVFRLDNGTLAKYVTESKHVELLDPKAAWKAGALKEEHLLRIQSYLCEVHAKLPDEGPLKSVSLMSSKRSIDTVLDVGGHASAKKAKSLLALGGHGSSKFFYTACPSVFAPFSFARAMKPDLTCRFVHLQRRSTLPGSLRATTLRPWPTGLSATSSLLY
jgi:hypothetical protein